MPSSEVVGSWYGTALSSSANPCTRLFRTLGASATTVVISSLPPISKVGTSCNRVISSSASFSLLLLLLLLREPLVVSIRRVEFAVESFSLAPKPARRPALGLSPPPPPPPAASAVSSPHPPIARRGLGTSSDIEVEDDEEEGEDDGGGRGRGRLNVLVLAPGGGKI